MASNRLFVVVLKSRITGKETRGKAFASHWSAAVDIVANEQHCQDPVWCVIDPKKPKGKQVVHRAPDWVRANRSRAIVPENQGQLPF